MRKLKLAEEKKLKEAEEKEEEKRKSWSIGAKDDTKQRLAEAKRQEKIESKAMKKKIYEEEHKG